MKTVAYRRADAVAYARRWALGRNPAYLDFDGIGGDCTNFVSQCLYAGAGVMNETPVTGWFYRTASDRTASWTSVEYLYAFLMENRSAGPFAVLTDRQGIAPGDVIQLGDETGDFYHSLLVTDAHQEILVAAHSFDALDRPLASYSYQTARFLHVEGVRRW